MLQKARGRGGRKADLRALAQQWGCKVVTLDELLTEIKKLKPLPPASKSSDTKSQDKSELRAVLLANTLCLHYTTVDINITCPSRAERVALQLHVHVHVHAVVNYM